MKISRQFLVVFLLGHLQDGVAWQPNNSHTWRQGNRLSVASRDLDEVETQDKDKKVPYAVARGDGSTGGGGLPMPNSIDDDGLIRPKVGAAMPEG
jgi:hypothetical protein